MIRLEERSSITEDSGTKPRGVANAFGRPGRRILFGIFLAAGLYQINVTIPAGLGTGDLALVATVGGAQTQPGVLISLQ